MNSDAPNAPPPICDAAIIGAGAAGLATAIFAARHHPGLRIVALDGARKLGAKILVAGGGRCNVTNQQVTPADFCGGSRHVIRRVLDALPVSQTIAFFREIGVDMHAEEYGKLFPNSNSGRTVLDALLREAQRLGVLLCPGQRVSAVQRAAEGGFVVQTASAVVRAARLVLATGGLALPKSGSDGAGYHFAQQLGHTLIPTTPALAPLVLDGSLHAPLSGAAQEVQAIVHSSGARPVRQTGAMLWTHFGISGPVVLDASRHWLQARLHGREVRTSVNFYPAHNQTSFEQHLLRAAERQPRATLRGILGADLPARVTDALLHALQVDGGVAMAHLPRDARRRLALGLTDFPLPVRDSRGYTYAEVTAGGVPLDEIDAADMHSRCCPGLSLVGEILDVDGRIGGFNFQWAWASGLVAGRGLNV